MKGMLGWNGKSAVRINGLNIARVKICNWLFRTYGGRANILANYIFHRPL